MTLSIIVPVFNEQNTIKEVLRQVSEAPLTIDKEIIVVDDGSSDDTLQILEKLNKELDFKLLIHGKNQGKGAAVRTGLTRAMGDFIIIQDADLEYDPKEYQKLINPLIKKQAKIVYGSRNLIKNSRFSKKNFWGGKFLSFVFSSLFGQKITDINTCYKVFKKEVFAHITLKENDFAFCVEVSCQAAKAGYKIIEVPIHYQPRGFKEGKKLRCWRDGIRGLWCIIKYRVNN